MLFRNPSREYRLLSRRHVDIGLVPLGAIGMTVFAVELYFAARGLPPSASLTINL